MSRTARPCLSLAPAAPYLDALAVDGHQSTGRAAVLADVLGISTRPAKRINATGEIAEHHADRLAARLGAHVLNLWPEWAALTEGATA